MIVGGTGLISAAHVITLRGMESAGAACKHCKDSNTAFALNNGNDGEIRFHHNPDNSVFVEFQKKDEPCARYTFSAELLSQLGILTTSEINMAGRTKAADAAYVDRLKEDPPCAICVKKKSEHANNQCLFSSTYFSMPTDTMLLKYAVMGKW